MSKVEDEVCAIIQARAKKVQASDKYEGLTMEREDLTHGEWLEHLQHELMDAAIYIQRILTREQTLASRVLAVIKEADAKRNELPIERRYSADGTLALEITYSLGAILDEYKRGVNADGADNA